MLRSNDAIQRAIVSRKHSSAYSVLRPHFLTILFPSSCGFVRGQTHSSYPRACPINVASRDQEYGRVERIRDGSYYVGSLETIVALKRSSRIASQRSASSTRGVWQSYVSPNGPFKRSDVSYCPNLFRQFSSGVIDADTSVPYLRYAETQNDESNEIPAKQRDGLRSRDKTTSRFSTISELGETDETEYGEDDEPDHVYVKDTMNPARIKNAYEGTRKSREDRRSREREIRSTAHGLTWKDILEELKMSTPPPAAEIGEEKAYKSHANANIKFVLASPKDADASVLSSSNGTDDLEIPKPLNWSTKTFTFYIRCLCRRCSSSSNIKGNIDRIALLMLQAFYEARDEEGIATIEAFNMALKFLHRYRKLPEARELFGLMENSSCGLHVSTINIFIHNAAEEQNIAAFQLWLRRMRQRNISPDCSTWAALLELTPSLSKRQEVAWEIERKQIVYDRRTAALVLQKVIPYSFRPYLEEGGDPESYLETLQQIFGQGFDDPRVVRQMLDSLASQGRFSEAILLVKSLALNGYRPSVSDLNILLLWCRKHLNADAAIQLVEITWSTWEIKLNRTTMLHLFKLFWGARMYNALWATWIYACMWNFISFEMRRNLLRSMQQSLCDNVNTVRERWETSAGPVVLGAVLSKPTCPEGITDTVKDLLTRKSVQHRSETPVEPFSQILTKALHEDKSWTEKGVRKSTETSWKIENKIYIPVVQVATKESDME